jgi:RimJ/RimL family protein N-acetyltransferase
LEDCQLLWQWSNDPVVRAASFNTEPIAWEEHIEWFNSKLNNPAWYCYILYNEDSLPIGQVRFDTMGYEAEISISISSDFRGHGYGSEAIHLASMQLFRETAVKRINAYSKSENTASMIAFTKASYKERGVEIIKGHPSLQMVLDRKNGFSENASCEN